MKRLDINQFKKDFELAFGEKLTVAQLWLLVKMCKNVRLRCRNNTAFNNFMNQVFGPHASFKTVTKSRPSWRNPGTTETYPGLSIVVAGVEDGSGDDEAGED